MRTVQSWLIPVAQDEQPSLHELLQERLNGRLPASIKWNVFYTMAHLLISDEVVMPSGRAYVRRHRDEGHPAFTQEAVLYAREWLQDAHLINLDRSGSESRRAPVAQPTPWTVDLIGDAEIAFTGPREGAVAIKRGKKASARHWREVDLTGSMVHADELSNAERDLSIINEHLEGLTLGFEPEGPFRSIYGMTYGERVRTSRWTQADAMPPKVQLSRTYNFDGHGRFYPRMKLDYTSQRRLVRSHFTINEEPTVELDFKANHVAVLCGKAGYDLPEDPYLMICEDLGLNHAYRDAVKKFTIIGINSPTPEKFNNSMRSAKLEMGLFDDIGMSPQKVREAFLNRFPKVHEMLLGPTLPNQIMLWESRVMNDVMLGLVDAGVYGLPLHDEVICPISDAPRVYGIMHESFQKHFPNTTPRISGYEPPREPEKPSDAIDQILLPL